MYFLRTPNQSATYCLSVLNRPALFRKDGYDLTERNNIKAEEILYNTDAITSIAKSIVHSSAESPFRSDNILL